LEDTLPNSNLGAFQEIFKEAKDKHKLNSKPPETQRIPLPAYQSLSSSLQFKGKVKFIVVFK
jgi:hypothetical protein